MGSLLSNWQKYFKKFSIPVLEEADRDKKKPVDLNGSKYLSVHIFVFFYR